MILSIKYFLKFIKTMTKKIPVTVLSWFLWSWKTTLLKHILENRKNLKVALIVNDMAELNIDAKLISKDIELSQTEEKMIELTNGCICCTLRDDLIKEIHKIAKFDKKYDVIIIESTWISEPVPVAQTLTYPDDVSGINLSEIVRLDTMVTVVDAKDFLKNFWSQDMLSDRNWQENTDDRAIVDLMTEQVEFCDVIVLNKISEISENEKQRVKTILTWLNPNAKIIETDYWKVKFSEIVNSWKFDLKKAEEAPLWVQELKNWGHKNHTPETEEYWIKSFVYRTFKPFHPKRFLDFVGKEWKWVIRSKWIFWLATRNNLALSWSQAWWSVRVDPAWRWASSFSKEELADFPEIIEELKEYENFKYWDRRQEMVIITIADNEKYLREMLDKCLLTDEEFEKWENFWKNLEDKFPTWI